jgi:hypothetical protein
LHVLAWDVLWSTLMRAFVLPVLGALALLASSGVARGDADEEVLGLYSGTTSRPFAPAKGTTIKEATPLQHPRTYRLRTAENGERMLDIIVGTPGWEKRLMTTARVQRDEYDVNGSRVIDYELPSEKTKAGQFNRDQFAAWVTTNGYKIAALRGSGRLVLTDDEARETHTEKALLRAKFRPWAKASYTDRTVYTGTKQVAARASK